MNAKGNHIQKKYSQMNKPKGKKKKKLKDKYLYNVKVLNEMDISHHLYAI